MRIQVERVCSSVITVELDGRFDSAGTANVKAEMTAVATMYKGVVVDLSKVSFLASIGLRLLLQTATLVQRQGGSLVLLDPRQEAKQVLEVTGVADLLPIYHDRSQALLAVSQHGRPR